MPALGGRVRAVRVAIAGAILIVAACGASSGGSTSPSPGASAAASPVTSPSPSPSPSPSRSPSASSSGSASATLELTDPDLAFDLPPGWTELTPALLRAQVVAVQGSSTAAVRTAYDELLRQIDDGEVRAGGIGPSGFAPWQATLVVEVAKADSIDVQIRRNLAFQTAFAKPTMTRQTAIETSIGDGVRVVMTAEPPADAPGAVAARGIAYYVDLGDGRIFWITSTAPEASTTFEPLMDALIGTLRRR